MDNATRRPPGRKPSTYCTGGWWSSVPVWMGAENLAPTGVRTPNRPAHSESLYRLCYRGRPGNTTRKRKMHTACAHIQYLYWTNHRKAGGITDRHAAMTPSALRRAVHAKRAIRNSDSSVTDIQEVHSCTAIVFAF